jgi:hypothetical protein
VFVEPGAVIDATTAATITPNPDPETMRIRVSESF